MKKLDVVAITLMIGLVLLIVGVIIVGNSIPISVTCQSPAGCEQVSPYGAVVFEFSRPVKAEQVEKLWKTIPPIEGRFTWLDERRVQWNSSAPLPADQTTALQLEAGPAGQNGERLSKPYRWEVKQRAPLVLAVGSVGKGRELFYFGLDGKTAGEQLTHSDGRFYDFSPSPDGEKVAFSAANDRQGTDLWVIRRDGSAQHKLLDCGADRCSAPAWSPVTAELAYTREGAGIDPNGPKGAPRIWILDTRTAETAPLFSDPQKIGYGPKWSPDGKWISIWNGLGGGIDVANRESGQTTLLQSSSGDTGTWSPDSRFLYYANIVPGEAGFHNVVLRADINQGTVSTIFGGNVEGGGLSVSGPVTSLTDPWVAVAIQENVQIPGKKLSLLHPDTKDSVLISDDLSRIVGFYSWTPDGNYLLFQLDVVGGQENDTEIVVWDRKAGKSRLITTGFRLPQWLP